MNTTATSYRKEFKPRESSGTVFLAHCPFYVQNFYAPVECKEDIRY